jgi:hypothetical protein
MSISGAIVYGAGKRYGSTDEKLNYTDNFIYTHCELQSETAVHLPDRPTDNRSRLQTLIYRRRTAEVSNAGRQRRNTLRKYTSGQRLIGANRIALNPLKN